LEEPERVAEEYRRRLDTARDAAAETGEVKELDRQIAALRRGSTSNPVMFLRPTSSSSMPQRVIGAAAAPLKARSAQTLHSELLASSGSITAGVSRSCTEAGTTRIAWTRPSVSTSSTRFLPFTFFPAS
jgi:hypothetical protein